MPRAPAQDEAREDKLDDIGKLYDEYEEQPKQAVDMKRELEKLAQESEQSVQAAKNALDNAGCDDDADDSDTV